VCCVLYWKLSNKESRPPALQTLNSKVCFPSLTTQECGRNYFMFSMLEGKDYNGLFGIDSELFMRDLWLLSLSPLSIYWSLLCFIRFTVFREIWCLVSWLTNCMLMNVNWPADRETCVLCVDAEINFDASEDSRRTRDIGSCFKVARERKRSGETVCVTTRVRRASLCLVFTQHPKCVTFGRWQHQVKVHSLWDHRRSCNQLISKFSCWNLSWWTY